MTHLVAIARDLDTLHIPVSLVGTRVEIGTVTNDAGAPVYLVSDEEIRAAVAVAWQREDSDLSPKSTGEPHA